MAVWALEMLFKLLTYKAKPLHFFRLRHGQIKTDQACKSSLQKIVDQQIKASEAVRNIAAKAAKQMFDKKKKAQDMKAKPPKQKWRYSNKSEEAIAASAHRDGNLNEWDPENMKKAYKQYDAQKKPT